MYTLCKYFDETELTISNIIARDNGEQIIKVIFERPTEYGFDTLVFELPSYKMIVNEGKYTEKEIELFKTVLHQGAAYFFEVAQNGIVK